MVSFRTIDSSVIGLRSYATTPRLARPRPRSAESAEEIVRSNGLLVHGTPDLRIHAAASAATISVRTADTNAAASMPR